MDRLSSYAGKTIAVLVPTYRRPDDLAKCLIGIDKQVLPPNEIVVVVRADDNGTLDLLHTCPRPKLKTVLVTVSGVVQAMNAGLQAVESDIVALTDDDAVPRPDWLLKIAETFELQPNIAGVGGRDVQPSFANSYHEAIVVGIAPRVGKIIGDHHIGTGPARDVDVLKGVNSAYRVADIRDIGFDETLLGSGAQVHWELSLGLSLRAKGLRLVYDPKIIVDHYVGVRHDDDARDGRSWVAQRNEAHNEILVRLRHLTALESFALVCSSVFIGTRATPGLVQLIRLGLKKPRLTFHRFTATMAGYVLGILAMRRQKKLGRAAKA